MIKIEHIAAIEDQARRLAEQPTIEAIPNEFFSIGLPGSASGLDSYEAVAMADYAIVAATGLSGLASAFMARQLVARFFLAGFADADQKQRWLPSIARGELWPVIAISEPNVGAHPKHLSTTATKDGNSYVLNGRKLFVTNGMRSDLILVLAVCGVEDGRKTYGLFGVPRDTSGFDLIPMTGLEALAPSTHAEMILNDCRVPAGNRIGGPADVYPTMALPFRDVEDGVAASGVVGLTDWLIRRTFNHVAHTEQKFLQAGRLAGLLELARAGAAASAQMLDAGQNPVSLGIGLRAAAADIVLELRDHLPTGTLDKDERLRLSLAAFDLMATVARRPREIRRAKLGAAFLGQAN
ncbi:acyl-CoA dehydrogenase [Bradyrhizobium sp. USDA 4502]